MTPRLSILLATAAAPVVWGTTYIVTTELLPPDRPLTASMLRALPAGLLLLAFVRVLPKRDWWLRVLVLGALNFSVFWFLLFEAAYRLPGGVAATVGALQPLFVLFLARVLVAAPLKPAAVLAAAVGVAGVVLLVIGPGATFDPIGILAGLGSAASMSAGVVLSQRWRPPVPAVAFTAWQLTAGGALLLPVALLTEPALPMPSVSHLAGFLWLAVPGAALTYILWFRGIERLGSTAVAPLGLLSPVTAVLLGWGLLGQSLDGLQLLGIAMVLASVWAGRRVQEPTTVDPAMVNHDIARGYRSEDEHV